MSVREKDIGQGSAYQCVTITHVAPPPKLPPVPQPQKGSMAAPYPGLGSRKSP